MSAEVKEEINSTPTDVKNDDAVSEVEKSDNNIKEKGSLKNETTEESEKKTSEDDNEEEEDDDDEEDDDEEVALLDRPLEISGCRARKKVERLEVSFSTPKEKQEFPEGKGKKLGECPRIEAQIQKMTVQDLKPLHKILFNRTGSANEIKKNIRKFCGLSFEEHSFEFNRKKASVEKLTASVLKQVCLILDIERGGTKEEIVNRIMSFLLKPEDSGKSLPSKKKAAKDKKKSSGKKTKSEKKVKFDKNESEDDPEGSNEDDDSTGGEASMGGTDEEVVEYCEISDEESKKKKSKDKGSKTKSKADKADKGKKDTKKTKATKRKQAEDSSASSEDEPPSKKSKMPSKMPSDEEISKLVKQILEAADLQEITMKKVIKQVSDAYPDFDLSHKKAFIKSTIKSVIS